MYAHFSLVRNIGSLRLSDAKSPCNIGRDVDVSKGVLAGCGEGTLTLAL
jgi:hypothetical protein